MASTVAELRKLDTANDRTLQRLTARLQTRLDKRIQNAAIFRSRMLVDMKFNTTEHREEYRQHIFAITQDIALGMAFADMIARLRLIRNAESQGEYRRIASYERLEEQAPDFLNLPFTAAIESFAAREPVLAMSAPAVTVAYQRQSFALARSTSIELTAVVQRSLGNVMRGTETYPDFVKRFRQEGLSDAYAETVFRTNLNTAQTAGRVIQASDPELRGFIVAWRYFSVRDTDTRPNHAAMDGFMASMDAPIWRIWTPPNGYACRCGIIEVTRPQAKSLGRYKDGRFIDTEPRGVSPDPGFSNSPVTRIYGGAA